jgi:DmsE family decaheme c-type cytochrome
MNRRAFFFLTAGMTYLLALTMATASENATARVPAPSVTRGSAAPHRSVIPTNADVSPALAQGSTAQAGYVGEATCLTCHQDQSYAGTRHGHAFEARTPAATRGCESCHGPGQKHAESGDPALIRSFTRLSPSEASETCTSCHNRASHALWDGSQHDQRNLGCTSCHSVHTSKGPSQLKAKTVSEQCASCHRNVVNKTFRFNHMPVREGTLTCASCHNVHGSTNVKLLKVGTTVDESCTSCHADKRGPYLWEHAPVSESCVTCHDPHGSNNDRMLVSKVPFLCQRCHVTSRHPPTVYEGFLLQNSQNANKIFTRGCVACHQMVHGSNSPSGKALLR